MGSHSPRRLTRAQSWRAVCADQVLTGAERAGGIAVAVTLLADPRINAQNVVLLDALRGGWSVMEFMDLANIATTPPSACPNGPLRR